MCSISWFFVFYSSTIHIYSHAIKFIPFCAIEIYAIWTIGVRARERGGARASHSLIFHWLRAKQMGTTTAKYVRPRKASKKNQYFSSIFRMWRLVVSMQKYLSGKRANKCQKPLREYVWYFASWAKSLRHFILLFYYFRSIRDVDNIQILVVFC